jgi:nitrogen regulatory protein P-II 1
MKKIEAIIRSEKVGKVRKALEDVNCPGLTITQVDGHGQQYGTVQELAGQKYRVGVLPKTKIETIVDDKDIEKTVGAIMASAKTGQIGDGKIFIYPVEEMIKVRTGERKKDVL